MPKVTVVLIIQITKATITSHSVSFLIGLRDSEGRTKIRGTVKESFSWHCHISGGTPTSHRGAFRPVPLSQISLTYPVLLKSDLEIYDKAYSRSTGEVVPI